MLDMGVEQAALQLVKTVIMMSENDPYKLYPELANATPPTAPIRQLFGYKWSAGFISPFRECPASVLSHLWTQLSASIPFNSSDTLLDLGCGRAGILMHALARFPELGRAVGIDLDSDLISEISGKMNLMQAELPEIGALAQLDKRLELWVGDISSADQIAKCMHNVGNVSQVEKSIADLVSEASIIILYQLPEAVEKMADLFQYVLENAKKEGNSRKTLVSIRWPIPKLEEFLVSDLVENSNSEYYIYQI